MKLKLVFLCLVIVALSCTSKQNLDQISISGRSIMVNDQPFIIKGICYHPVPKGEETRSFETLEQDLKLMKEAGINTIRVYAPIDDRKVLDAMYAAGMKLVVGFGYNQNGNYDILSGSFTEYIENFKNHPVLLMWELGNEYNYHPEWFEGDIQNWYNAMNSAALKIKEIDKSHPVTTAHGEIPDGQALSSCPAVDVWGMNVYRWDNPETIFEEWQAVSNKPMYLSEAGGDSFMKISAYGYEQGVNEKAQANATENILKNTLKNTQICSGVTLFSFTDGWWKAGNPQSQDEGGWAPNSAGVPYDGAPNEEYWGIVDIDRNKKEAFQVVKKYYRNNEF